jgi:hypothetical protein
MGKDIDTVSDETMVVLRNWNDYRRRIEVFGSG